MNRPRFLHWIVLATLGLVGLPAQALPSFARQTGQECAACHVGAFGPQLTPFGQKFKIGGYTDGKFADWGIPVSGHLIAGLTNTAKSQPDPEEANKSFSGNNNTAIQEVSGFVAGKLTDSIGTFSQVTYSGIEQKVGWDSVDVRFAREITVNNKQTVTAGLSLNNKPTTQDPFNTIGQWSFPYTASELGFGPASAALLSGGNTLYALGQNVLGLTAYAFINDSIYAEAGGYRKLQPGALSRLGAGKDSFVSLSGTTPYWRLAYTKDWHRQNFQVGVIGMDAVIRPEDGEGLKDRFHDLGVDASYMFLGTRKHIVTVNAAFLREKQSLDYTNAEGGADNVAQTLNSYNVNTAYYYRNTYGVTLGAFGSRGSADETLYASNRLYRPDTSGGILQVDWTPNGKEAAKLPAWMNYRLAAQYTAFSKYAGSRRDFDGAGRNARDNNTLFVFLWTAL